MIITQTPLRISFAGGGTDFSDFYKKDRGCVLSSAIDKYLYVIVKERFNKKICVNYTKSEIVDHLDQLEHSLVRETMRRTGVSEGIEITTLGDVPSAGSGLGSSSSLTVGLLNALYAYQGNPRPAEQLAREACEIEIDILGKPIGKQDQYIAAYGNIRSIDFIPSGKIRVEDVKISENHRRQLNSKLMLFYTCRTRKSEDILENQKQKIPKNRSILQGLRDEANLAKKSLENGNLDQIGKILDKGWKLKKQLDKSISDNVLDNMYKAALDHGATGGKICGAGGGGFLLLYCPNGRREEIRQALKEYPEMPFSLEQNGSKIIFNARKKDIMWNCGIDSN